MFHVIAALVLTFVHSPFEVECFLRVVRRCLHQVMRKIAGDLLSIFVKFAAWRPKLAKEPARTVQAAGGCQRA
jgi:hypothetical protein